MSKGGPGRPEFKKQVDKAIKELRSSRGFVVTKNLRLFTMTGEEYQRPDGLLVKQNGPSYEATVIEIEDSTAKSRPNLCGKASLQGTNLKVQMPTGELVQCAITDVVFVYPKTLSNGRAAEKIKENIEVVTKHHKAKSLGLPRGVSAEEAKGELRRLV